MTRLIPQDGTNRSPASFERRFTLRAVTVITATVVGLTFLFGFGNVWTLAVHLGVTPWVAPLVAPAVDLSVIGLLLATWYLALHGAPSAQLRPARQLLVFASLMTLALNVTEPALTGHPGKAAFDAVGPLLLIGWAEVGPGLLQAISATHDQEQHTQAPATATNSGSHTTPRSGGDTRRKAPAPSRRSDRAAMTDQAPSAERRGRRPPGTRPTRRRPALGRTPTPDLGGLTAQTSWSGHSTLTNARDHPS